jgi:2-dehydropantoate 2-reductase
VPVEQDQPGKNRENAWAQITSMVASLSPFRTLYTNSQARAVGAIGSLLAAQLTKSANFPITLLLRRSSFARDLLEEEGSATITIERLGQTEEVSGLAVEWLKSPESQANPARFSLPNATSTPGLISTLFVAGKAQSVVPALKLLSPRLSEQSTVVFIQNGAGILEAAIDDVFQDPRRRPSFLVGSTSHAGYRRTRGQLQMVWAAQGELMWAAIPSVSASASLEKLPSAEENPLLDASTNISPTLEDLPDLPSTKSLRATISALLACRDLNPQWLSLNAFRIKQLQKLVGNAVINTITAILDVRNGAIPNQPAAQTLARQVCAEASSVFAAHINQGQPFHDDHLLNPRRLAPYVLELAEKTNRNMSSTLADMRNRADSTELFVSPQLDSGSTYKEFSDYMNGYISRLSKEYGIPTPVNDTLLSLANLRLKMIQKNLVGK